MTLDELGKRRAGRREANLRELNQRIADAQHDAGLDLDDLQLVCECSREGCEEGMLVPATVFEGLRDEPARFLIKPGHVLSEVERQVVSGEGWVVVEKHGTAARAASEQLS